MTARKVAVSAMSVRDGLDFKVALVALRVSFMVARVARRGANSVGRRVRAGSEMRRAGVDMRADDRRVKAGLVLAGPQARAAMPVDDRRVKAGTPVEERRAKVGLEPAGLHARAVMREGVRRVKVASPVLAAARVRGISRVLLEVVRVRGVVGLKGAVDSNVTQGLRASGNT
jgi:hypothetical protein